MADDFAQYGDLPYVMSGLPRRRNPYDARRQMAMGMVQGGMDFSPVAHPLQGASRLAQALVGSLMMRSADSEEAAADKARQEAFGKIAGISDPQERIAALGKIDPEAGARYAGQVAMQEIAAKRKAADAEQAARAFGGGMDPGMGGGQQIAMPPEQAKAQASQYVNYLVQNHGFAPEQAAAMVGNLFQESGFNPTAVHDNGTGFGMGGWRLDRRDALLNFAKQAGRDPANPQTQLDFFATELKGRPEFQQFQQAQTPQDRQAALMTYFRPAGWTPQTPQAGNGFGNRVQYAQTFAPGQPQVAQGDNVQPGAPRPVADGSGNPLPPIQPPRPTEIPRPAPDPELRRRLQQMIATQQMTVAEAQRREDDDINRRWQFAQQEAGADNRLRLQLEAEQRRAAAAAEAEARREANKPPTAEQSLSGGFADRMTVANDITNKLASRGTDFWNTALDSKIFGIGIPGASFAQSDDYKRYVQARDDFINAQLRRESGAAISDPEYERANKQYFPQPNDPKELIEQKARNRALAVEGMKRNAGPNYKPDPLVQEALRGKKDAPGGPQAGGGSPDPASLLPPGFRVMK